LLSSDESPEASASNPTIGSGSHTAIDSKIRVGSPYAGSLAQIVSSLLKGFLPGAKRDALDRSGNKGAAKICNPERKSDFA
jgi:hypothetical protein